jgi:hypothetical protein
LEKSEKHCVGTIALMMMTQCLYQKKTKEAFMLLYLMNSKEIHYVYPALPFVVQTPRVILTAAEICLAVEQPKQIFEVMRLVRIFILVICFFPHIDIAHICGTPVVQHVQVEVSW